MNSHQRLAASGVGNRLTNKRGWRREKKKGDLNQDYRARKIKFRMRKLSGRGDRGGRHPHPQRTKKKSKRSMTTASMMPKYPDFLRLLFRILPIPPICKKLNRLRRGRYHPPIFTIRQKMMLQVRLSKHPWEFRCRGSNVEVPVTNGRHLFSGTLPEMLIAFAKANEIGKGLSRGRKTYSRRSPLQRVSLE